MSTKINDVRKKEGKVMDVKKKSLVVPPKKNLWSNNIEAEDCCLQCNIG